MKLPVVLTLVVLLLLPLACRNRPIREPQSAPGIVLADDTFVANPGTLTDQQNTCLAKAPEPDCVVPDDAARALTAKASEVAFKTMDDPLTYHNDSVDGRDNTVDLLFRRYFIDQTYSNNQVTYQHTHGKEHALVVMTKGRETACKPKATLYKLQTGDQIEVYYEALNATIPWKPIHIGPATGFAVRLTLETRPRHGKMGCEHKHDREARNLFWKVETPTPHPFLKIENVLPGIAATEALVHQTQNLGNQYLRKVVVRGSNGSVRHYQNLNSGCSAWRVCTRVGDNDCDSVPLCAVYLSKTLNCGCEESQKQ